MTIERAISIITLTKDLKVPLSKFYLKVPLSKFYAKTSSESSERRNEKCLFFNFLALLFRKVGAKARSFAIQPFVMSQRAETQLPGVNNNAPSQAFGPPSETAFQTSGASVLTGILN